MKTTTFTLQSAISAASVIVHDAGTVITIRQPKAGELRGLSTNPLIQGDYNALEALAPRITQPRLEKQHIAEMDPADLTQFHLEVLDFLLPSAAKQAVSPTE